MDILSRVAEKVQKETGVRLHRRNVERLLSAVLNTGDFWKIVDLSDLPVPAASGIVKSFVEEGVLFIDDAENILLTQRGYDLLEELGIEAVVDFSCGACEGRGYPFYGDKELYRTFVELAKDRPGAIRDYDQGAVTPETTVSRVLFIDSRGDLRGKDVLVMGAEDDLTGLAVALTRRARSVLVIDIDERLIDFDKRIFRELGIDNAEAKVWDLRKPFPEDMLGRFDVFITDPPETFAAFRAFIGRGIATLKEEGCAGYFGLTLRDSSIFRWKEFQETLLSEYGTVITDIVQDFNHYMNWEYHPQTRAAQIAPVKKPPKEIWYRSAWFRIETLPGFKRWNEPISDEVFYLDEEGSTT
ncbi:MAG TPA: putative methyltransferase [Aquifex aeolicus]|uniref:N(4)-bis(aminopropyl)spermidine synthase n=1 Tax=Aquifex aeolicus TaxID=63363 RepID=A0A7C5L316_AQUAO|nr:putative methyltransferase [Aquifex aeolicus]